MADVKWKVDIDVPGSPVKNAATEVGKLEKTLRSLESGHHAKTAEREIASLGEKSHSVMGNIGKSLLLQAQGFHGLGTAMGESRAKLGEFLEFFGAMEAVHLLGEMAEKIVDIGKEAIKAAAAEQRMKSVFSAQFGGDRAGEAAEKWADVLAKQTELNEAQTEGALIDLKRVGATEEQAALATKAAADIAAVSKDKNGAFASTIEAFARIQRTGVISNRALAPLGIGVKDFKQLDSMKGLSEKEIKKRMESGKVDQGDLFRLIMSRTNEKAIGERAANNADLLGTKLQKLTELPELFYKKLADTKAIGVLSKALGGLLDKLDPESPAGAKIFSALEHAFGVVADTVARIDIGELAATITDDVIPAVEALITFVGNLIGPIEKAIHAAHELHDVLMGPAPKNTALDDFEARQKKARDRAAAEEEPSFLSKGIQVSPGVKTWHSKFHVVGKDDAAGLAAGITAGGPGVAEAAGGVADKATDAVREKHKTHSPSVVFQDLGAMAAAGFAGGVMMGAAGVESAMDHTFGTPTVGGAGAGGGRIEMNLTIAPVINLAPGDGEAQGRRAADAFDKRVRGAVMNWLEEAGLEGGLR